MNRACGTSIAIRNARILIDEIAALAVEADQAGG